MNNEISTIMTTKLVTLSPEDTVSDARNIFKSNNFHHIPICKDCILVGVVTTFDLLRLHKTHEDTDLIPLKEVMTTKLAVLNPTDKIGAASVVLLQNRFHSVPVVDEDRKLVGMLTTFDLLKYQYNEAYPGDDFPF
ncbi:MAG TPA: CBS domain-containing protein [Membranihabitans sp.]|nr:CBS domain-containing protein [Membranihabitans sp.]